MPPDRDGGKTILTDPWFSTKENYYQGEPIAIGIPDLPDLDAVLITHAHYDHCDLDAFRAYRDLGVPLVVAQTVVEPALAAGFTDVRPLQPWDSVDLGGVTVTAAPAAHAVYEITFVIGDGDTNVYFAGDTLFIPELAELPTPGRTTGRPAQAASRAGSRPLIAVLDAKPGLADALRLVIVDLGRKVRAEPGCLIFTPYESKTFPGRFYIYEVYQDAAAFGVHIQSEHVRHFMSELPALSTNGLDAVVELDEIPIPQETA